MTRNTSRPATAPRRQAARIVGCLLSAALLAGTLASCRPAPELGQEAAKQLQSRVLAVTEAAAASDPSASLKLLDELVTTLDGAAARGDVSFTRHQSIKASIDAVRADLTAAQAAEQAAAEAAAQAAKAAAEQEAAARAAAAAASTPVPAPAAPAPVPADSGKAKGKGKGNG